VVAHAERTTRVCRQPDYRPDLKGMNAGLDPTGDPQTRTYFLAVRNRGLTAAGAFDVVATVNGVAQPAQSLPGLDAKHQQRVELVAPRCTPGSTVDWAIDPDNRVAEADESNNALVLNCPSQTP
jgi:subtilase family serine protease